MAYGAILNQKPQKKMLPEIIITPLSSLTSVTATSSTGKVYNGTFGNGVWTITVGDFDTYTISGVGTSETTEVVVDVCKQYNTTLPSLSTTLNDNSWAVIRYASDNNLGESLWSVGDTKQITLNGTIGITDYNNYQLYVYIIGFNHNAELEGDNRIHFQIGKIDNVYIALCDSNYNSTGSSAGFRMNLSNTNSGGWKDSYMRKNVLGNSGTPSSPPANSLLSVVESGLRNALKSVNKWTDNTGGGSNSSGNVTSTTDYFFLLAEFEVFGSRGGANQYEQNQQAQYDFYKSGNSKIRYRDTATSTDVWWWLRSPFYNNSNHFLCVSDSGSWNINYAYYSGGFAPAFVV